MTKQWRIYLILGAMLLLGAAITGRLVFLQVLKHDFYLALAQGQQKYFLDEQGERGKIFFDNYDLPVATVKTDYFIYASPPEILEEEKEEIASVLSEALDLGENSILEKLQTESLYELISEGLTEEEAQALEDLGLKGIYLGEEKKRDYPYGSLASHVLGFVNKDGRGQYGIEEYWDDFLTGKEKIMEGEKGPLGYFFNDFGNSDSDGYDLTLTLDYNIQYFTEKLLIEACDSLKAEGGTIIVINPGTGVVMALAEYPSYNPNQYYLQKDLNIFQTDALQKVYEPGSVFKPITMAAALNEGKITPQTVYQDPGMVEVGGWPIYNYNQRRYPGDITMTEVLEKSINTGAVFAESQLSDDTFLDYIEAFGIFEKTGIDLPGELLSSNKEFKKGYEINFATASFGQGIEMTPIQLVRAFSAIANGGKLITPFLVKEARNDSDTISFEPEAEEGLVISQETASKLTAMLTSVVENGFSKAAKIPGYYVAGKTGTAQVSYSSLGQAKSGYSEKTWQSFIGFAPAFSPQFLILVKLNNPQTNTAEYSALPVFKNLAKYLIDYYQIPPDYEL